MEDLDEFAELFEGNTERVLIYSKKTSEREKEVELHPSPNFTEGKA